jgi:hypothetical protein
MILPDFLGIGTQRGATTWLYNCLKEHPELFLPDVKEVSFFNRDYEKGLHYYSNYFRGAETFKSVGEVTPGYLYCKDCPERIAECLPAAKMIVVLRNPVERAYSAYQFFMTKRSTISFEDAISKNADLLENGLYHEQLERYFSHYRRNQFLILLYDDLKQDNLGTIRKVYEFIGVDPAYEPSWVEKTVNVNMLPGIQMALGKMGLGWAIEYVKKTSLDSLIRRYYRKKKKDKIKHETRRRLTEYFREPNERLEKLIDRDLSSWMCSVE